MWVYIGWGKDYSAIQWPCPEGFHIPTRNEWVALCWILTTTFWLAGNATTVGTYLKMPMASYRYYTSSSVSTAGTGRYWSSTNSASNSSALRFDSSSLYPQNSYYRANGFTIRCFKDTPIIPNSSRTTLYQGTWSAWAFRNSSLWLISVSWDGTTWYTIQDKNLWATTVYNQWNTLSDANCGYFYQWWNNYGFPHSGTVTTSSTQVDASWYWPGNYYESGTFITTSLSPHDWSSVQNDNLWWWVTWVVSPAPLKNAYIGEYQFATKYQEVEYIENNWWQYIDTWYQPNQDTEVECRFSYVSYKWNYDTVYWARNTGSWASRRCLVLQSNIPNNNKMVAQNYSNTGSYSIAVFTLSDVSTGVVYTTKQNKYSFYLDWALQWNFASQPTYSVWYNLYIFTTNVWWTAWGNSNLKLYYTKIWDSWTLVRDLVPCYRKSDNVIWMYDLVNDVFYINSWSWTFTKWADVN